jgi:mercuric ion transport protein
MGGLFAAVVCCAAPLLVVAAGSLGVGSLLANGFYLLIPVLVVALGLIGLFHYRRRAVAKSCCDDVSLRERAKH